MATRRRNRPGPTTIAPSDASQPLPQAGPKRRYGRNFLKQVLARIDFAGRIEIPKKGPPRAFVDAIKKAFPEPEEQVATQQQLFVAAEDGVIRNETVEVRDWFYYGRRRDKKVHLGRGHMFVEYTKYTSYGDLRQDFLTACDALFKQFPDLQAKRLGLRYINNFEFQEKGMTSWEKYLQENLLTIFKLADDPSTISRAFHVLEFNYGDMGMRFQYGMPNPDHPAPIRRKLFTLDYDAYCTLLLGRDEIAQYLDTFHEKINRSFEEVITDGLRKKMRAVDVD